MSAKPIPITSPQDTALDISSLSSQTSSLPLWDRLSNWVSENKAVVYTIAGIAVVVTGAGVVYYRANPRIDSRETTSDADSKKKASKKERRKAKKEKEKEKEGTQHDTTSAQDQEPKRNVPTVEADPSEELPQVDSTTVDLLSEQERKDYASKLKVAGNKAYGDKSYNDAIELYGKAILCKPDPIFYSNRAACHNALGDWDKVVEDTSAAIALDSEYVKALNRRANAYESLEKFSEALLDYTASCIIDGFRNEQSAQSVERLLKKVAEAKGKAILDGKEKKLPSPTFVTNYLQSFRPRPRPKGLEEAADLDENSGKGWLRAGLVAMEKKTGEGYDAASAAFDKALELRDLGEHEAFAYNMRGTFRYLRGENADALKDLDKSVDLQPSLTQSYIKRASMHLELGNREGAANDFEKAMEQKQDDPDIYYHRAQLHFILAEFADAAKDYQKSIDLDKDFIFSHIQLGVTQYKMGSIASSMATFRRCIKNFDKMPDVYNYYGELLLDQQKYSEAIEKFETAIEMEKQTKPLGMNVLPLINKALALFQWKQDFQEAEKLCQKALIIDPECDIAVATMAQLLLQQGKVTEALKYFERAAELSRTEGEIVNALSYAEATRTQLEVQQKYPQLASRLQGMGGQFGAPGRHPSTVAHQRQSRQIAHMVAPRRTRLAASRRRVDEEGEDDEEGSVVAGADDDSMSDASVISDADEDADAEGSEVSDMEAHQPSTTAQKPLVNGQAKVSVGEHQSVIPPPHVSAFAAMTNDTAAMMNGLKMNENADEVEEIHFDDWTGTTEVQAAGPVLAPAAALIQPISNVAERRRQEHEEYRKKRDADPSFVPNRGGFFMHDHRSLASGQNGFRPFPRGRGRGRGALGGPPSSASRPSPALGPADAPWAHDLHETVTRTENEPTAVQGRSTTQGAQAIPVATSTCFDSQPPNRSFSKTTRIGKVQIRVLLPSMREPIVISAAPVNQHTRLPHHRPPLRRDKPVRVSLPDMPIRYIFPSLDRSFIFIPRALRPNQQGFGRARARGSISIGYGPLSSRRTSAYAGSAYSPSVAPSRRSSLAREVAAETLITPSGLPPPRPPNAHVEPSKPVVRLPPASQDTSAATMEDTGPVHAHPEVKLPQVLAYPLPEKPTYRENRPVPIPMHQPKPQKTVSVTDIESPATFAFSPPQQQDQQPFHQQVPTQVVSQAYQQDQSLYPHSRHPSHPSQASGGTPLSQIPERAAHAHPFQPYAYQQPLSYYAQQYPPTLYYYPPADQLQAAGHSVMAPAFVPGQAYPYAMPAAPAPLATEATSQPGTVAHESNGMVYYYDSSQLPSGGESNAPYVGGGYGIPQAGGVVGMGGMITPPIQYYPQSSPAVFYPPT
ncbi:MAG: hypothetical protein Q9219_005042 [cf. Caloplaca sp. 3 TL-2023]